MAQDLRLVTLGGLQISRGDAPLAGFVSGKVQALLCFLAVTGRSHLRPALAGLLWGEMPDSKADTNLRKALSNLRQLAGEHLIFDGQSVAFDRGVPYWLDAEVFGQGIETIVGQAGDSLAPDDAASLAETLALYRDDFLAGFYVRDAPAFEEWVLTERERLHRLALQGLQLLVNHHAARGENGPAIDYAARLLALDPWRERAHRQMMRLLARSGQRSAALVQYETCRRVLAEELGIEPMPETVDLYERIRTASARRFRLPAQPTPFVGREEELARIAGCFEDPACRLLTLVGPGGIGKTRLALEIAAARRDAFLDGVYFVPLAGVGTPDLLVAAIADALSFSFYGRQAPRAQLLSYVREKEILLVLDNFEQLLAGPEVQDGDGATLLSDILEQAPQAKILVTSRQRLNLRWEWLFDVQGLAYPGEEEGGPTEACDAVQLFALTAGRIRPDFSLAGEGVAVARICRLVEGLPLAIELAAAGVRVRPCSEIAAELGRNLDLLATPMRDVPPRHRSVRAAFDGSWQLLPEEERRAFGRLAIFRGGFDRQAAWEVTGTSLSLLDALAARSLLHEVEGHRYRMHALLQQFAAEKLAASGREGEELEARHSAYYAALLRQQEGALHGPGQQEALRTIGREIGDVRAAWQRAIAGRQFAAVERLLKGLYRFYDVRGWLHEGRDAFAQASEALSGEEGPTWGRLLVRQGWFCFRLGLYEEARELGEKSLSVLARTGRAGDRAFAHLVLGSVADEQGAYEKARSHLDESLALYQQAGDRWNLARTHDRLGDLARMVGDYDQARHHYEQCLALYEAAGGQAGIARALNSLGTDAGTRGDYDQARAYFEGSLDICRELDDRFGIAGACHNLGNLAYVQGDYAGAKRLRQETLTICRQIGFRWGVADSLRHLGDATRKLGEYDEARRLFQESLVLKREIGHQRGIALALGSLGGLSVDTGAFGQARRYYCDALQVAQEMGALPVTLSILAGWGELLARQGEGERALEVLAFVLHHPAAEEQTRDSVAQIYAGLQSTLAVQRGREQTLDEIVGMLLA